MEKTRTQGHNMEKTRTQSDLLNKANRANRKEGASAIGLLLVLLVLAAGAYWWFGMRVKETKQPAEDAPAWMRLKWMLAEAEKGDVSAMLQLAKMYAEGLEMEQDWKIAATWYRKAAEKGNSDGAYQLGRLYELGNGVDRDWAQAEQWYWKAAEQGHPDAEWKMGLFYRDGRGVTQDKILARIWLEKAAHKGHKEAKIALARLEEPPNPVIADPVEADRAAAEAGDMTAQYRMGKRYMEGNGVAKDETAGAEWYKKAAEQGDAESQYCWGECLDLGKGVGKDAATAETWYRAAAEQGNPAGQRALGKCRMAAGDKSGAVKWLRDAADGDDAEGQYLLAVCYQKGLGTAKDLARAKKWLQRSAANGYDRAKSVLESQSGKNEETDDTLLLRARQGHPKAQYALSKKLFQEGKEQEGLAWMQQAAQRGLADAAIWLGRYYDGRDAQQSFYWWNRAADLGSLDAMWTMVGLCQSGTGTRPNDVDALRWAKKAAEHGHKRAMWKVAMCYEEGVGCKQDYAEAKRWYARAGDQLAVERMDSLIANKGKTFGGGHTHSQPPKRVKHTHVTPNGTYHWREY